MKFRATFLLTLILGTASAGTAKTKDFEIFWKTFKAAVVKNDKEATAAMTKFPFDSYQKTIRTRSEFLKKYGEIFAGEADARQCFPKARIIKDDTNACSVYCGFKQTPDDPENAPIRFRFELTKAGWKLAGLENINE